MIDPFCKHEHLHTEKMIVKEDGKIDWDKMRSCIVTFCADCGAQLKIVEIQNND